jgi:hypothetical protein
MFNIAANVTSAPAEAGTAYLRDSKPDVVGQTQARLPWGVCPVAVSVQSSNLIQDKKQSPCEFVLWERSNRNL